MMSSDNLKIKIRRVLDKYWASHEHSKYFGPPSGPVKLNNATVDIPELTKCLCIFPLRSAIVIWGLSQLIATIVITIVAICHFKDRVERYGDDTFWLFQLVTMFIIALIVSMLEICACGLLVYSAYKKTINLLVVCLDYLKVKVSVYAVLLLYCLFMKMFVQCQFWFWRNLDPWRNTIFMENMAVGVLDLVSQIYLLILVRSLIIKLNHQAEHESIYSLGISIFPNSDIPVQGSDSYVTSKGDFSPESITCTVPVSEEVKN